MSRTVPEISIIVATFNYGQFIAEALGSIAAQSSQDWECIVIDDASTDDTAEVVDRFVQRDARFNYIRLETNSGVSVARNRGLLESQGEFIQLLDADDVIAPWKLERQLTFLKVNPGISVVYSDFIRFTGDPDLTLPGELTEADKFHRGDDGVIDRLIRGNAFRLNTVLFRRKVLEQMVGFRPEYRHVEDWDFWIRMALAGSQFHFLDDPECNSGVRVDHRSLSKDLPAMRKFQLPVRQYMFVHGPLKIKQRISLLLRYCDFLLEMVFVKRESVLFLSEGRFWFTPLVVITSTLMLPFWVLARPFIRRVR